MNYSQLDVAFLAGFFEGEGCMWMAKDERKDKLHIQAHVALTNNDINLLLHFQAKFGGTVHTKYKVMGEYKHFNYQWHLGSQNIGPILSLILPFLITKKELAQLIIEFRSTIDPTRWRPLDSVQEYRLEIYEKYLKLMETKRNNVVKIKFDQGLQ